MNRKLLILTAIAVGPLQFLFGGNLMNVSWGDFVLPDVASGVMNLDTPEKIDASIANWHEIYGVDAVLWRTSDEEIFRWCEFRDPNGNYKTYLNAVRAAFARFDPAKAAIASAHRRGVKFFLYETFLDQGSPTNVLYNGTVPYPWQVREMIAHPDWQERDLAGNRHYGVLDLSNPAARTFMIRRLVERLAEFPEADGLYLCDRTHAKPADHADQFGFGPATVAEYLRRYGVDITKDPRFDCRSARFEPAGEAVRKWRALRGEYLVAFYRELRRALPKEKLVYLALPRGRYMGAPYGNLEVDTPRIVRERLADGIILNVYSGRNLYSNDKVPHRARGYLSSMDDRFGIPSKAEALAALREPCREHGVKLFYAAKNAFDPGVDGIMMDDAYPASCQVTVADPQGMTCGEKLEIEGVFRLSSDQGCVRAPRLLSKYCHDDNSERGWEIFVHQGRVNFHVQLVEGGELIVTSKEPMPRDRWVRLVARFDGVAGVAELQLDSSAPDRTACRAGSRLRDNRSVGIVLGAYAAGSHPARVDIDSLRLSSGGKTLWAADFEGLSPVSGELSPHAEGLSPQVKGTPEFTVGAKGGRALRLNGACTRHAFDRLPHDRLGALRKPWANASFSRLSPEEYERALKDFAARRPDVCQVSVRARTAKGLPIHLVVCTDRSVREADKSVVFVSTLHSGYERSGTAGVMAFLEWLLSDDPEAAVALKGNVVVVMPNNNPEAAYLTPFLNSCGLDPYAAGRGAHVDMSTLLPKEPAKAPEILAFQSVSDEFTPDVNIDVHGIWMDFDGHLQPATVGRAGSNSTLNFWDERIDLAMQKALADAGFGAGRPGFDSERSPWGPAIDGKWRSFYDSAQPFYYTASYGYLRNHTQSACIESTWTQTVTEPLKALLAQSCRGFSEGPVKDFRVNRIRGELELYAMAGGVTKAERRRSRVELWRNQRFFSTGSSYPATANWTLGAVVYGAEEYRKFIGKSRDADGWPKVRFDDLLRRADAFPYADWAGVRRFLAVRPPAVNHVLLGKGVFREGEPTPRVDVPVSLLVRLPLANAELLHVSLNGRLQAETTGDEGYERWNEDGYTCVRIKVPAAVFNRERILLSAIAWNPPPGVKPKYGWRKM